MKHLPNIITALRIAGSIDLLFCNVAGWQFWTLYVLCGLSDMVDGWLARKLQAESKTGSVLDRIPVIPYSPDNQLAHHSHCDRSAHSYFCSNSGRIPLTLSFQFHHTQMDGAHAGKFLANLQNEINRLA